MPHGAESSRASVVDFQSRLLPFPEVAGQRSLEKGKAVQDAAVSFQLLAVANNAAVGFVPESFVKILPGEVAPPPPVAVSDEPSPPKAQPAVATVYSPSAVLAAVTKPLSASLEVVQGVVEDVAETTGGLLASGLHEAIGVVGSRTNAPPQLKVTVVVGLSDFQPESEEEIQMRTDGTPP